ncbi:hypothetical protein DSO57_1021021 [Entomophthora muscae]|uniref:Uncharacterized protein n=1 Tax=Entomophthora muscae TaxID=34485 RepID=A0ACC2RUK5_9FUNG|nr:hypothetical protein DSO57_1021021 [Entomophthora muscae]
MFKRWSPPEDKEKCRELSISLPALKAFYFDACIKQYTREKVKYVHKSENLQIHEFHIEGKINIELTIPQRLIAKADKSGGSFMFTGSGLSIDQISTGKWMLGLDITSLRLDLINLSILAQTKAITSLNIPSLQRLHLRNFRPNRTAIAALAKFKTLQELAITYFSKPDPLTLALPDIPSLQYARLASSDHLGHTKNICLNLPTCLTSMIYLDLGPYSLVFNLPAPVAPNLRQLAVTSSFPQETLEFHFSFIRSLKLEILPQAHEFPNLSRFIHLTQLQIDFSSSHLTTFPPSPSVTQLTIQGLDCIDDHFWECISHFPSLYRLTISSFKAISTSINYTLPNLQFLITLPNLPPQFPREFKRMAPQAEIIHPDMPCY